MASAGVTALREALLYQFNGASGTIGGDVGAMVVVLGRSCPVEFPNSAHKPTVVTGPRGITGGGGTRPLRRVSVP
jgi:hypothetical protein